MCAEARALRRRRCAVVRTLGRRCPRGQVGSGVRAGSSGHPGTRTAPLLSGCPGARRAPLPRGLSESAQSPFPARPGPRPSDALALAGQLPSPHPFSPSLLRPAASSRLSTLLPSETVTLSFGISDPFSLETNISHFAFCRHLKGKGERQMTTLNTGSARFGTAVSLLKLSLPPSSYMPFNHSLLPESLSS